MSGRKDRHRRLSVTSDEATIVAYHTSLGYESAEVEERPAPPAPAGMDAAADEIRDMLILSVMVERP